MDLISNIFNVLPSCGISCGLITAEQFKHWAFVSGIITGCITASIIVLLYLKAYKAVAIKFVQNYPKEKLLYIIESGKFSVFVVSFFLGSSIGLFLFPSLLIKDFSPKALFFALGIVFILYEFIILYTTFYVLTDKRICLINPYEMFKNSTRKVNILYDEIQEVSYKKSSGVERIIITLKNGRIFDKIAGCAKLKRQKQ